VSCSVWPLSLLEAGFLCYSSTALAGGYSCVTPYPSGWWDDRKRNQKPVLPLYLRLDIPSNLSRALSCLRLSGHNFLVQRMRHDRNRRPYELRICDGCDWHTIQDEEHILLDCPHEHLVRLCTQQQLIFPPEFEDGPARLRTFMNQPDIFGVASFVAKCLALFP
jgi:hypothetical protein